jgi:two-component system response regulator YesN
MIVDDEMTIRLGLETIIDWEKLNCTILNEAADGIEALEKIDANPPDIVITDIRMPGMDGLELAKNISRKHPGIKVIILTGYADFEYAQTAIRYGVLDFVLKPTEISSIESAVNKAVSLLEAEANKKIQLPLMQEKLITDCINLLLTDPSEIAKSIKSLSMESSPYYMVLGELETSDSFFFIGNDPNNLDQQKNYILKNVMELSFKDLTHWCAVLDASHCCAVVSGHKLTPAEDIQEILTACQDIIDVYNSSYGYRVSLGISKRIQAPGAFRQAYEQSVSALSHHSPGENGIYIYVKEPASEHAGTNSIQNAMDRIIGSVKLGKIEACAENINVLFSLINESNSSIERTREIVVFIASGLMQLVPDKFPETDTAGNGTHLFFNRIFTTLDSNNLKSLLSGLAEHICTELKNSAIQNNMIINQVNEYISKNYKKNIHLAAIANHVHVNSSYLSRLYRRETNITLTEAISKVRIEKAKELLRNPKIKAYEAASLVGIEDPAYFSLMFKKYTGYSPTEYRQISNM